MLSLPKAPELLWASVGVLRPYLVPPCGNKIYTSISGAHSLQIPCFLLVQVPLAILLTSFRSESLKWEGHFVGQVRAEEKALRGTSELRRRTWSNR